MKQKRVLDYTSTRSEKLKRDRPASLGDEQYLFRVVTDNNGTFVTLVLIALRYDTEAYILKYGPSKWLLIVTCRHPKGGTAVLKR